MPCIISQGLRFANPLAALCIAALLCAASIAGAEPEATQSAQAKAAEAASEGGHRARTAAAKKKIALAQFDVANTQHVDDINNIYDGLPLALARRLEASGEFLTVYSGRPVPAEAGEAQREAIMQIAEEAGAQFLISGKVVNAGASPVESNKRHIEIELAVHDGLTGTRLLPLRLNEQAVGNTRVGNDKPFGSSIFFETELGLALNRLLDVAVSDTRAALEKVPFSAHIIRVEANKVYLDAGSDALLKPGDQLVAYARDATPIVGLKGSDLGAVSRPADIVTLSQIQPQFSVGELTDEAAKLGVKVGNIARIDPEEQRILMAKQIAAQQMAKAEQEARAEAERMKAEQAAQAEAARVKAEQEAKAEAARVKAEQKARAQAAAEAKAAKLKAAQQAKTTRISAAQQAKARAEAQAARLKAKQEADAKTARSKSGKKAATDAASIEDDKAKAKTGAQQAASGAAKTKTSAETTRAKTDKAGAEAQPDATSSVEETKTGAEAAHVKSKPGVLLKLKPIKP